MTNRPVRGMCDVDAAGPVGSSIQKVLRGQQFPKDTRSPVIPMEHDGLSGSTETESLRQGTWHISSETTLGKLINSIAEKY
jgi:hypothetical protein